MKTSKDSRVGGHRISLGSDAKATDNGRTKDAERILTIDDPRHSLHSEWRDQERYTEANLADLIAITQRQGCPQPFPVRIVGTDVDGEPIVETIAGNRRTHALRIVNRRLAEQGTALRPFPAQVVLKAVDTPTAKRMYLAENNARRGNTLAQNVSSVRDAINTREASWEEVAEDLGRPGEAKEVATLYQPLLLAADPVITAFEKGTIKRSRLVELIKLPMDAQEASLQERKDSIKKPKEDRGKPLTSKDRANLGRVLAALLLSPINLDGITDADLRALAKKLPAPSI